MKQFNVASYVNGEWTKPNQTAEEVINPYTGKAIGKRTNATESNVEAALVSAYSAKKEIANIPAYERANILNKAALLLEERKEKFAKVISQELGKPMKYTLDEVARSIETLEFSGEEAKRLIGETIPGGASARGTKAMAATFRVPIGVVAAITPFNAPLNLACHKLGPAFAAGNSVIFKPASQTPFIANELVKLLMDAGFPENAINMLYGNRKIVQKIVKDDRVNVISFTGGVVASKNISSLAGIKKVVLELGGNSATIVHEDADLTRATQMCTKTSFSNSGQSCISVQRIYVHKSIFNKFTEMFKSEVSKLKVGDPLVTDTDVGSMVNKTEAKRVSEWIDDAVSQGATLFMGGKREGAVVEPTVLLNPLKTSNVVCEEVFGPVVSIIPYETLEEAIDKTNDSAFGLQAGLFTNQMDVIYKVVNELEMGGVVVNGTSNFRLDHLPYGGVKNSGIGREGVRYAVEALTESKMLVYLN